MRVNNLKYAPLDLALTLRKRYKPVRQNFYFHFSFLSVVGCLLFLCCPSAVLAQVDTLLSPVDLKRQEVFTKLKEALKTPEKVIVLDLGEKDLKSLPESLQRFVNLQKISLYENQLKTLPEWIGDFPRLQWIDVYSNALKTLPASLSKLQHLWYLDVGDNQLREIPEVVYQLTALKHLYLYGNHLKTLPTEITRLSKLEHLRAGRGFRFLFGGNHLRRLPENIGELSELQELHLPDNALRTLPASFSELKKLRFLELGHNRFREVPSVLHTLSSLEYVSLWDRNLKEPTVKDFVQSHPDTKLHLEEKYAGAFWAISAAAQQGRFTVAELGVARAWRKDIFLMALGLSGALNLNGKMQSAQASFWLNGIGFLSLGAHLGYFWEENQNNIGFRPEIGIGTSLWNLSYGHQILYQKGSENIPKNVLTFRILLPISPGFPIFK